MDKRWDQLAHLLVNWSVAVRPGERVIVAMHEVETLPLTVAVYREAVKAGASCRSNSFRSDCAMLS